MAFKWTLRRLHRSGFSRQKLRGGVLHRWLGDHVLARDVWFPSRESFARAWLIGMIVTMIPFLPAQTVIACGIGLFFRANVPICFILQFLSSPATAFIQLPACYIVGSLLLGHDLGETLTVIKTAPKTMISLNTAGILLLGGLVLGVLVGVIGYFLTQVIWKERVKKQKPLPSLAD